MIEVLPGKADGPHPTDLVRIDSGFTKRPDRRPRGDRRVAERLLDLALASTALGLALPLLGLVGPILLATQGPPLFYRQVRVGRGGTLFTMVKVRTMHRAAERETGPVWATPGDPRVTRLGAFLRRTHLDEVPQFWNVLRGEMSLIGPRPERLDPPHAKRFLWLSTGDATADQSLLTRAWVSLDAGDERRYSILPGSEAQ